MTDHTAADAFMKEFVARKLERRRAVARLPIGEKFRILEELHEANKDLAAIRAARKSATLLRDKK